MSKKIGEKMANNMGEDKLSKSNSKKMDKNKIDKSKHEMQNKCGRFSTFMTICAAAGRRNGVKYELAQNHGIQIVAGTAELTCTALKPYSDVAIEFLSALSAAILQDTMARNYPDVISFAYWCRAAHLKNLRLAWEATPHATNQLGRGLALHIAPGNVPVNFAFSYVFALLAGNASIVRLPTRSFAQVNYLCSKVESLLPKHPEVGKRSAFVRYDSDSEITSALSLVSNVRIIWGGDTTVSTVGALAKNPRCKDIVFADRYSIAVLDKVAIAQATNEQLVALAQGFYNDTYLMDQNACSSPHLIFWLGNDTFAAKRFWQAVADYAKEHYRLQPQIAVDKYVQLCDDIINDVLELPAGEYIELDTLLQVNNLAGLPDDLTQLRGVGGYFYQYQVQNLAEIAPYITERYQTLLYYGIDKLALQQFVLGNGLLGVDRIVPVGQALDIDIVWDGCDLIGELSRIVDVR